MGCVGGDSGVCVFLRVACCGVCVVSGDDLTVRERDILRAIVTTYSGVLPDNPTDMLVVAMLSGYQRREVLRESLERLRGRGWVRGGRGKWVVEDCGVDFVIGTSLGA